MCALSIAAIILAAGSSQRLGRPKQNEILAGETLLQRAIRTATNAGLSPIVIVIRGSIHPALPPESEVEAVINPNPDEGIASSIRCGIEAVSLCDAVGAVIMTCDQPAVTARHLRALVVDENRITGSCYMQTVGVPAYFPKDAFVRLKQLQGDSGARTVLQGAYSISAEYLELDVDTQQDLDRARALFDSSPHDAS